MSNNSIFTDTNTAQVAYAVDKATQQADVTATTLTPLNVLSSSLSPDIQTEISDDIRDDGQYSVSKTVGGSSGGDVGINLRFGEYDSFLEAALRNTFQEDTGNPGTSFLWNGNEKIPFLIEHRIKRLNAAGDQTINNYRRFYSQYLGSMSIELNAKQFVSSSMTFMGLGFENFEVDATTDPEAGRLPTVTGYNPRGSRDPFDSSNSVTSLVIKNSQCEDMHLVLEQGTVEFNSNLREDDAVGNRYAANIGFGRFMATLNGTFYFRDDSVLNAMLNDENLSMQFTLVDGDAKYTVTFPRIRVTENGEDIPGVDNTLRTPFNIQAFPGEVEILGETRNVTCWIRREAGAGAGDDYQNCWPSPAPTTYTLTYTAGVGGAVAGDTTQTVSEGGDGAEVIAVADSGYVFVQWSDGVLTEARTDTDVQSDITVEAEFELE